MASFESLVNGLQKVQATLEKVSASASSTTERVERATTVMREMEEVAPRAATALDDLAEMADKWTEDGVWWASEIQVSIEAIRVGALSLDDFLTKMGDAVIKTADGTKTIRDLLAGMDWTEYTQLIQDFIDGLRKGTVELDEVIGYLTENAGQLTERLGEVFEKYRDGKVTLEHLVGVINALKGQFEGSELDALLDSILAALARGDL